MTHGSTETCRWITSVIPAILVHHVLIPGQFGVPGTVLATANTNVVTRLGNGNTSTTGLAEFSNTFAISANLVAGNLWLVSTTDLLPPPPRSEFYWESTPSTVANDVHFGEQFRS